MTRPCRTTREHHRRRTATRSRRGGGGLVAEERIIRRIVLERRWIGDELPRRARTPELGRKAPEPRREQEQLVHLVRRHLGAVALRRMEDVLHHLEETDALAFRARHRVLATHAAATDEIDAVVALVPRHGVDERERLDGEA